MDRVYSEDTTALFVVRGEYKTYMYATGLTNIQWMHTEKTKVCESCKSLLGTGATCKQCGAPAGNSINAYYSIGKATATLCGILPISKGIINLHNGDTIHVLNKYSGSPDRYYDKDVFAVLSNIYITKTSIPTGCGVILQKEQPLQIFVNIEFDFSLVGECSNATIDAA